MLDLSQYQVQFAQSEADLEAAQRLRYQVFVTECGGHGPFVDHSAKREIDKYDAFADHLILRDTTRPEADQVIGTYRVMTSDQARRAGGFSSAGEYDLTCLTQSAMPLLELGRSCIHPDHRRGPALLMLWQALARHVSHTGAEVLFGLASFPGTDLARWDSALRVLHQHYRAEPALRPYAIGPGAVSLDDVAARPVDRKAALVAMPPLIKSYLRVGGRIGEGAFVDTDFNTIDVCMLVQVDAIRDKDRSFYGGRGG